MQNGTMLTFTEKADEPTGNLDSAGRANVLALLRRLVESGQTLVMVTHDGEAAATPLRSQAASERAGLPARPTSPMLHSQEPGRGRRPAPHCSSGGRR
jgi:hypothetical protein